MAFKRKGFKKGNTESKYIRLTGLWQSKGNEDLYTGKAKEEQIEKLLKAANEALESGAPLVFSLWVNNEKESRKDPEFSLQTFVGDVEEKPRERGGFKRKNREEEEEEENNEEESSEENNKDEEAEDDDKPRGKSSKTSSSKTSKRSSGW